MKAYFDPRQLGHKPEVYYRGGAPMPHPEQPQRAILIRDMLLDNGFPVEAPSDFGLAPIKAVHDPDYVDFFVHAHDRFFAEAPEGALGIPTRHPGTRRGRCPTDINGAMGWWMTDTSTPLTENTYQAIYWSAQTAISAAKEVMDGARASYGLSRPPGHHAMTDCANGFCFYNNAAIAAHHMRGRWDKVALLDVDVHTGNGSMDILYDRGDIFFCSLHPDPAVYPTFYLGYADETGEDDGAGKTRNEVLNMGDGEPEVMAALDRGIAVLDETVFERATDPDVVAFDKTGTLTTGEMSVVDVVGADRAAILERAAAVEGRSNHPIGGAILKAAPEPSADVSGFERNPRSVAATVDGDETMVGHPDAFARAGWTVPDELADAVDAARADGAHPTLVGWDGAAAGVVVLRDTPRPGWDEAIGAFDDGTDVVVITGDDERAARRFEDHPDVDEVFAEVRPEAKRELIRRLRADGTVTMVGDGTNDAAALASADLGIAMSHGTELTIDAADAVVTDDDLSTVPAFFGIADRVRRRIRENLLWAVGYNLVAIPLAVAGLINPLIAAVLMGVSSLIVVTNSRRSLV